MSVLHERPTTRFSPPDGPDRRRARRGARRAARRRTTAGRHAGRGDPYDDSATSIDHLQPGDVLVVNTSATVPGQLDAVATTAAVVVHVANRLPDGHRVVEIRTAPDAATPVLDARVGERLILARGRSCDPARARTRTKVRPRPEPGTGCGGPGSMSTGRSADYLARHGRPISYGYLRERFRIEQYQTVFAVHPGSAEMPSAGRPFTPELVTRLVARGSGSRRSHCTPRCPRRSPTKGRWRSGSGFRPKARS